MGVDTIPTGADREDPDAADVAEYRHFWDAGDVDKARGIAGTLWERHRPWVEAVLYKLLESRDVMEEKVQDVAATFTEHLPTFRGDSALRTWLHRIAVNAALAHRRHTKTREGKLQRVGVPDLSAAFPSPEPAPPALLISRETRACIDEAIAALPEAYRDVVRLSVVEDLTNTEIADALGLEVGTVKSRLHRGRLLMQKALAPLVRV